MKTWALAPEGDDVETDALCSDFFFEFLGHDTREGLIKSIDGPSAAKAVSQVA